MLKDTQNQRSRLLLQAVRLIGGQEILARLIEVKQSTLSKWISNPDRRIPYDKALLIEQYTGIRVELLCQKATRTNRYLRENYVLTKLALHPIVRKEIVINEPFCEPHLETDRPIIIGNDGVLISGRETFNVQQRPKTDHLRVAVLDLEALWAEHYSLEYIKLLYTERFAISFRIDQLLGNQQGQRNDLKRSNQNSKESFELCLSCDEVQERKDEKLARVSGFTSKDAYHRIKQVCCHGIPELLKALNHYQLSVSAAATIAELPKTEQKVQLELKPQKIQKRKYQSSICQKPMNVMINQKGVSI